MEVEVLGGRLAIDESYVEAPPDEVRRQVDEYERGERRTFDLAVRFPDTFGGRVLRAIEEIPFGETRTYGALAATLDTAPVAVGSACAGNPVPLLVPCHRMIGTDGELRGYPAPGGVELKRGLLDHERRIAGRG